MINIRFSDFRTKFMMSLDKKTGWGKEEIKKIFDETYFELNGEDIK